MKFNLFNKQFSLIQIIGFIGALLIPLAVFSNFNQTAFDVFFSSDALYLPSIYKDIFIDGNTIKGWHFNPAPNFFPDMLLYFLLMPLASNSFIMCSFLFALAQYVIILYVFSRIFQEVLPNHSKNWLAIIYLMISVFLLEYLFLTKDFYYTFYLINNSYHTGSFTMSLICLLITLRYLKNPNNRLLLYLFILGTFCVLSDKLFIILYAVPVVVSCLFLFKKYPLKSLLRFIAINILFVIIGIKIFNLLSDSNYIWIAKPYKMMDFNNIGASADIFYHQIIGYMSQFGFKSLSIYLFIVSFLGMVFLFFKIAKRERGNLFFFTVYSIVFSIVVLLTPILNGNYTGHDTLRYNIYPFFFAAINIAVLCAYFIKNSKVKFIGKYATLLSVCALLFIGIISINLTGLKNYFTFYPKTVQIIDEIAKKENLKCGVGDYWTAKRTTLFSKNDVKLYACFDDLAAYTHVTNENWFFKNNEFNFIYLDLKTDTSNYKKHILNYETIHRNPEFFLIKTNTFIYEKDTGYLPVNKKRIIQKLNQ